MEKSVFKTGISAKPIDADAVSTDAAPQPAQSISPENFANDPLLACLEFIARHFSKPFSASAVTNGLPLRHDRLSVDLVPRAAARLGLSAQLVRRRISKVPAIVLPYIILFDSGDACVVIKKNSHDKVTVVFPSTSEDQQIMTVRSLQAASTGFLFYLTVDDRQEAVSARQSQTGERNGHWLWSAVMNFWPSWVQIILAAFIINLLGLALPLFVMNVYDRVIPNLAIPTLWALAAGVSIAIFFDILLKQLRTVILDMAGRRVDMQVAASLYEHALGISMQERPGAAGAVANQIREFESVRDFFTSSSIVAATDLLFIGIFIFILWVIVGPIAFVALAAVPIVLLVTLFVQFPLARAVKRTQFQSTKRHSILVEGLIGVEAIKSVGGEGVMQRRWEDAVAATARATSSTKFWSSLALHFTAMIQQIVSVVIIVWGVFLVAEGTITVGGLIAANILAGRVLAPLGNIALTVARAQHSFAAMAGISEFMKLRGEHSHEVTGGLIVDKGELEVRNVSFTYPSQTAPALENISFKASPGERIGVIGRVGSGKTTLGKLIARLYTPSQGSILVDGTDARQYEVADLRAGIGYVSQEPELFAGTLRDNIVLGKPTASDEEISDAVDISGVKDFSASHPLGLNMPIGERGRGLSGGQRHAVTLARMLLKQPKILFLDEPSGALDTKTEAALVDSLRRWSRGDRTLIVCTHRGSFLNLVDRIVVIERGRLVVDGPRDAVLTALKNRSLKAAVNPVGGVTET